MQKRNDWWNGEPNIYKKAPFLHKGKEYAYGKGGYSHQSLYEEKITIFCRAFNYLIYDGKPVVDPERLRELDTTEIALPFGLRENEKGPSNDLVQKYRDILKSAVVMQEDEAAYILLGIENQTDIHYAMPVRNMICDALQYGKQVADTAANHRKN